MRAQQLHLVWATRQPPPQRHFSHCPVRAHTLPQLLGVFAGLPASQINRFAAKYLAVRVAFAVAYLGITDLRASFIRTGLWWTGNVLCFRTLLAATRALNASSLRR